MSSDSPWAMSAAPGYLPVSHNEKADVAGRWRLAHPAPMPRQNRVLPTGEIIAHPARGLLTGNRGILHDEAGELGPARWRHPHWISCALIYKDWRREVMTPGTWTELFFLDEAVALSAGHRPCALCRRADYTAFRDAWGRATDEKPGAADLDRCLHAARIARPGHTQQRHVAPLATLPRGAFVLWAGTPHLVKEDHLLPYDPQRYGNATARPPTGEVTVLTPRPMIDVLRAGYRPILHGSATRADPASA